HVDGAELGGVRAQYSGGEVVAEPDIGCGVAFDAILTVAGSDVEHAISIRRLARAEAVRAVDRDAGPKAAPHRIGERWVRIELLPRQSDGNVADRCAVRGAQRVAPDRPEQTLKLRVRSRTGGADDLATHHFTVEERAILRGDPVHARADRA